MDVAQWAIYARTRQDPSPPFQTGWVGDRTHYGRAGQGGLQVVWGSDVAIALGGTALGLVPNVVKSVRFLSQGGEAVFWRAGIHHRIAEYHQKPMQGWVQSAHRTPHEGVGER